MVTSLLPWQIWCFRIGAKTKNMHFWACHEGPTLAAAWMLWLKGLLEQIELSIVFKIIAKHMNFDNILLNKFSNFVKACHFEGWKNAHFPHIIFSLPLIKPKVVKQSTQCNWLQVNWDAIGVRYVKMSRFYELFTKVKYLTKPLGLAGQSRVNGESHI